MENAVTYDAPGLGATAPKGFTPVRPGTAAAEAAAAQDRGRTLAATGSDVTLAVVGALLVLGAVGARRRRAA